MTVISTPYRSRGAEPSAPRLGIIAVAMAVAAALLAWQLVDIQVANPDRYREYGLDQRLTSDQIPAERGAILDRNGLLLAGSVASTTITANPRLISDPRQTATDLAPILGLPVAELEAQLRRDSYFAFLAREVDDRVAERVADLGIAGIFLDEEPSRHNPGGDHYARAVLGRSDLDGHGISGLETLYDDVLTGVPGQNLLERTNTGELIPSGQQRVIPAIAGDSLVLTLDQTLQYKTEQVLVQHVTDTGAAGGVVVVLDNTNGDILSMATVSRSDDDAVLPSTENRAVTWQYEPGSIAKPLTFAGVLEAGLADLDSYRDVPDSLTIWDATFTDADEHPIASWSLVDILQKSSNIGTIMWAQQLGDEGLYDSLRSFGIGEPTAVGFPNEAPGLLHDTDDWSGTSLPTIAIGQGVAVTPLQMAQAYATIANGGVAAAPRLAQGSQDGAGNFTAFPHPEPRRVISESTAGKLTEMLTAVVAEGTGINAAIPGYDTAGKTGTAWKPQPGGGYEDEAGERHFVASFAGFLPADDPAITIVVVIDEPSGTRESGGSAAAPVFAELSLYALRHLRIPPSTETAVSEQENVRSESLVEQDAAAAAREALAAGEATDDAADGHAHPEAEAGVDPADPAPDG
ncbi:MAG: penicillin-binding protein 2 [Acidimicrobiia bacterium]|nr:penicillin-binding protein 2 [Acidimicrobiia bacterium]